MKKLISYVCSAALFFTSACSPSPSRLTTENDGGGQAFNFSTNFSAVNLSSEAGFFRRTQNFFSQLLGSSVVHPVPITGRFFVDNNGNSNYTVPLQLPPDVSRVGVHLTLSYNSGSLNGYLGVGWRLSGFSQISLCGQNYFFDQAWSHTRTNDKNLYERNRFCLDGQRLVAIEGSYGASGTIYHTETFNGMRIRSVGGCGNGPCSFEVFDRKGNKRLYGATPDSALVVASTTGEGSGDILTWVIDEVIDKDGRKIDFVYEKGSQFDNTFYPSSITYGMATGKETSGVRKIDFNYENAPVVNAQNKYLALTTLQNQAEKRLQNIVSTIDGRTVISYNFQYEYNSFSRHSRLVELSYCDNTSSSATKCFAHSSFEYPQINQTPNSISFEQSSSVSLGTFQEDGVKFVLMDKYGDGYTSLGVVSHSNGSAKFQFFQNDGKGLLKQTQDSMLLGEWGYDSSDLSKSYDYHVLDKNGDGLNDFVKIQKGSAGQTLAYSYLSGFNQTNFRKEANPTLVNNKFDEDGNIHYILKDINGDGLSDIAQLDPTQSSNNHYNIKLFYSSMKGGFPDQDDITQSVAGYVAPHKSAGVDFVDIDGDGLTDLHLLVNASGEDPKGSFNVLGLPYYHYKNNFTGPQSSNTGVNLGSNTGWNALPVYRWMDFNNDGLQDLLMLGYQSGTVTGELFVNTGGLYNHILSNSRNQNIVTNSFVLAQGQGDSGTPKQQPFQNIIIGDMDGDNYPDLFHYLSESNKDSSGKTTTTNNKFELFRNTGTTFSSFNQTQDFGDNSKNYPVDLNGDGVLDILSIKKEGQEAVAVSFINRAPKQHNHLLKIQNGIGRLLSLNYGQLSDVHDIDTKNLPTFPYIIYKSPRMVVHSYSDQNGAGANYSYQRKFNLRYTNGIFNRHNWQFYGFQRLDNHESARDLLESRSYRTTHPFRGVVSAIEMKKSTTGEMFSGHYFDHDFQHIYSPSNSPTVKLVRKLSSHSATFHRPGGSNTDQEAYRHAEEYGYGDLSTLDGKYGNMMSLSRYSMAGNKKGSALNYCYTYLNKTDDDNWALGFKTGERASRQNSCKDFTDPKSYQWNSTNDLRLLHSQYDETNLRVTSARSYFYDQKTPQDSGWIGSTYTYDNRGHIQSVVQNSSYAKANGQYPSDNKQTTITFGYDDYGFVNSRQYISDDQPEQLVKQISVDPRFGRIFSVVYPSGVHIKGEFDELGLLSKVFANNPSSNTQKQVENYSYVSDGKSIYSLKQIRTDWSEDNINNWHYHKVYYDGNQSVHKRVLRGFSGTDRVIEESRRDPNSGRIQHTVFPYFDGKTPTLTSYTYDDRGRLQRITRPDGFRVSYNHSYDIGTSTREIEIPSPNGECSKTVDPVSISLTYNHIDRFLNAIWPDKSSIKRNYNLFSRQTEFKDGRGLSHSWTYDSLGRVNTHTSPDAGMTIIEYDAHSRPSRYQFHDGTSMQTLHDGLGRLVSRVATKGSQSSTEKYVYSEKRGRYHNTGQLTSFMLGNGVSFQYNYDSSGNMAHQVVNANATPQGSHEFTFQYSPLKQKTMMTYPDQSSLHWTYAPTGQLKAYDYKEGNQSQNLATVKAYNSSGSASALQYGNQMAIDYGFDNLGRLTQLNAEASGSKSFLTHNYCYNSLGLKVRRSVVSADQNVTENFNYDMLGRLSTYTNGSQSSNYRHDGSGNLLQKGGVNLNIAPKSNQITGGTLNGATLSTSYDGQGRLQVKTLKKDNQASHFTYDYDGFGRLVNYTYPQGSVAYQYGINGHRFSRKIKMSDNTSKTSYYVSPYYEIHTDGNNTSQVKNMQLNSLILASKSGDQLNFFVRDHLGSLLATIDSKGQPSAIQQYDPYGKAINAKMGSTSEFTGRKYDQELQHYDFIHRYYDPDLGRFLTPDPLRQYASGYGYAGGQPLNTVDRNGLVFGEIAAFVAMIASAIAAAAADMAAEAAAAGGISVTGVEVAITLANGLVVASDAAPPIFATDSIAAGAAATMAADTTSGMLAAAGEATQAFNAATADALAEGSALQVSIDPAAQAGSTGASAGTGVSEGVEDMGSSLAEAGEGETSQAGQNAVSQTHEEATNEAGQQAPRSARNILRSISRRFVVPTAKFIAGQLAGLAIFSAPTIIQQTVERHKHGPNLGPDKGNDGTFNQQFNTSVQSNRFFQQPSGGRSLVNAYNLSTSLGTPHGTAQVRPTRSPSLGFPSVNTRGQGLVSISDPQYFNDFHQERRRAVDYSQILLGNRNLSNHYPIYIGY